MHLTKIIHYSLPPILRIPYSFAEVNIHKPSVAAKETHKALYWLRLINRALYAGVAVTDLIQEANQLVAILTSFVRGHDVFGSACAPRIAIFQHSRSRG